jgi:hypothetical protein
MKGCEWLVIMRFFIFRLRDLIEIMTIYTHEELRKSPETTLRVYTITGIIKGI